MPWCPRCDETFPEGPACPRCSARLVARERETPEETLETVPGLRSVKVSRRYLRAFERLSGPRPSGSRALALALVLLVFSSGFLLGRLGSVVPSQPVVGALPSVKPIPLEGQIEGSLAYLYSAREDLATIAQHDLFSGTVEPRARLSLPPSIAPGDRVRTRVVSLGRSVALIMRSDDEGYVAFSPHGRAVHAWIPGVDAAWLSEAELVVRESGGTIRRFASEKNSVSSHTLGDADQLIQSPSGPVVRRGRTLESLASPRRTLDLPAKGPVVAVTPETTRAVMGTSEPVLWDGERSTKIRSGPGEVLGAMFDGSSEHVALVHKTDDGMTVAVSDMRGNAALKPIASKAACATPSWDDFGRWIYVASSDGMLHAVEAAGGDIHAVEVHSVGCGAAWIDAR
ncbi:MAG: hypothetical protein WD826_07810 [Actinomycetota bacterium]